MKKVLDNKLVRLLAALVITVFAGYFLSLIIGRLLTGFFFNTYEETGNYIGNIVSSCFMFIVFVILYTVFFIMTPANKDLFISHTDSSDEVKTYFPTHMKTVGTKEIILYAAYSAPLMAYLFLILNGIIAPQQFFFPPLSLLSFQVVFYEITKGIPGAGAVIGYLLSIAFFALGYAAGLRLVFRKWTKAWYIKREDLHKTRFTVY